MKKIKLTQNKFALVDDSDYSFLMKFKWCAHREKSRWYAITNVLKDNIKTLGKTQIRMHQMIMERPMIDHINGDGLDNRKVNLRACTHQENNMNRSKGSGSSKFKGVYWDSDRNKWVAQIKKNRKGFYLGSFIKEEDAYKRRKNASELMFGDFDKKDAL